MYAPYTACLGRERWARGWVRARPHRVRKGRRGDIASRPDALPCVGHGVRGSHAKQPSLVVQDELGPGARSTGPPHLRRDEPCILSSQSGQRAHAQLSYIENAWEQTAVPHHPAFRSGQRPAWHTHEQVCQNKVCPPCRTIRRQDTASRAAQTRTSHVWVSGAMHLDSQPLMY